MLVCSAAAQVVCIIRRSSASSSHAACKELDCLDCHNTILARALQSQVVCLYTLCFRHKHKDWVSAVANCSADMLSTEHGVPCLLTSCDTCSVKHQHHLLLKPSAAAAPVAMQPSRPTWQQAPCVGEGRTSVWLRCQGCFVRVTSLGVKYTAGALHHYNAPQRVVASA